LIKIAPAIAWNNVEGELALFDSRNGAYHALNGTGAAIWRAIADGLDPAEIAGSLAAAYDAPRDAIESEIAAFIGMASAKGLLEDPA
jgi:Coenzyme PQQ synthesis protein D (PqqD)